MYKETSKWNFTVNQKAGKVDTKAQVCATSKTQTAHTPSLISFLRIITLGGTNTLLKSQIYQ